MFKKIWNNNFNNTFIGCFFYFYFCVTRKQQNNFNPKLHQTYMAYRSPWPSKFILQ